MDCKGNTFFKGVDLGAPLAYAKSFSDWRAMQGSASLPSLGCTIVCSGPDSSESALTIPSPFLI